MANLTWHEFEHVDIRTGTIIEAMDFPEAKKPAYRLRIDFGSEIGVRKSSAQITDLYSKDDLIGKQILAVINFPPKQIGPWMSECLVLGITQPDGVVLLTTERTASNGLRVH